MLSFTTKILSAWPPHALERVGKMMNSPCSTSGSKTHIDLQLVGRRQRLNKTTGGICGSASNCNTDTASVGIQVPSQKVIGYYLCRYTWIFETAQIIAFSGKNAVTASFSKDGVFCCDEAHAGRKQKETASLSVQTASLGVQTASFPVHGFCTTHKMAFFFDYGVFSLKNASGKNLCRLKIQVYSDTS